MRLVPRTHAGQLALLLFIALLVAQGVAFVLFAGERARTARFAYQENILARTATLVRLLDEVPAATHDDVLDGASTRIVRFSRQAEPLTAQAGGAGEGFVARELGQALDMDPAEIRVAVEREDATPRWWRIGERGRLRLGDDDAPGAMAEHMARHMAGHMEDEHRERFGRRLRAGARHPVTWIRISVPLSDGGWLNVAAAPPPGPPPFGAAFLASLVLSVAAAGLVAFLVGRRIARPLGRLAETAEAFGRGEQVSPLAERGPDEMRRSARAFNEMRERIDRYVSDRSAMLAAVSHDLRTPITSLRLRAELVEDAEAREKLIETVAEMQAMTESVLAFLRSEAAHEETRSVDISALADSVVADLAELGLEVTMEDASPLPARCRPGEIRRALKNLIENAVRYGQRARVSVAAAGGEVRVRVEDDGPGIAPDEIGRVFEPFVRLDESRSRDTGGVGLGLSIARSILRAHGGEVTLANRPGGGLAATLSLPAA